MPGKNAENTKIVVVAPERSTSATIRYNGQPYTTASGYGIDTLGYGHCHLVWNVGTVQGAVATLTCSIYESTTDNPSAAALISGATFTTVTSSSTEAAQEAHITCKNESRYLFFREECQGTPITMDTSALCILSEAKSRPVSKTLVFDLSD